MSRPTSPACKTRTGSDYTNALKRRGLLTIHWLVGDCLQSPQGWFGFAMIWEAVPRGRLPNDSDAAIEICLTVARQGIAQQCPERG